MTIQNYEGQIPLWNKLKSGDIVIEFKEAVIQRMLSKHLRITHDNE